MLKRHIFSVLVYKALMWYNIDVFALLRLVLAILAVRYYEVLLKRPDAKVYQCKTKQTTFLLFAIDALAHLTSAAFGSVPPIQINAIRALSELGIAFTQFQLSQNVLKYAPGAFAVVPPVLLASGAVRIMGLDVDVLALASIFLVLLSIRNFTIYSAKVGVGYAHFSARKLFTTSLLAAYTFQFISILSGSDLSLFVSLSETVAVSFGFYSLRAVVKEHSLG